MLTLWNVMNQLANDDVLQTGWHPGLSWNEVVQAAIDVKETDEAYVIVADMPGVRPEDVQVDLDGRLLTIAGERQRHEPVADARYHRQERRQSRFTRRFTLPQTADPTGVGAALAEGVLTVTVPKKPHAVPRKIAVKGATTHS